MAQCSGLQIYKTVSSNLTRTSKELFLDSSAVEQLTVNQLVASSILARGAKFYAGLAHLVEQPKIINRSTGDLYVF